MTELRRDDPVDLDMPVFPHLYIEYVVGQTIEHYVEQSRVKAPYRTISRRMFSDIEVEIGFAFSSRRQLRTTWASPARNRGSFPRHGELGRHARRGKDIIISRRNARRNGSIEPSKTSTTRMRANNAASVLARPRIHECGGLDARRHALCSRVCGYMASSAPTRRFSLKGHQTGLGCTPHQALRRARTVNS